MIKENLNSLKKGLKGGLDWTGAGLLLCSGEMIFQYCIQVPIIGVEDEDEDEDYGSYYKTGMVCSAVGIASGIVCKGIASIL